MRSKPPTNEFLETKIEGQKIVPRKKTRKNETQQRRGLCLGAFAAGYTNATNTIIVPMPKGQGQQLSTIQCIGFWGMRFL